MPALPEALRDSIRIDWHLTSWCNYRCDYCPVDVFHQRSRSRRKQAHSFDHYPVEKWLEALQQFRYGTIYLNLGGGEPFLDRRNLHRLLSGLLSRSEIQPTINTNGFWDPAPYRDMDTSRIALIVSYHPNQVEFDKYLANLRRIRDAGFRIGPLNLVLAPENIDRFEAALTALESEGFFVNGSPMISTGLYWSRHERTSRELDLMEKYSPTCDSYFLIVNPPTKGRLCFYPAMSYSLSPDGTIQVTCRDGSARNLFTEGIPPIPREAVPCDYDHCIPCGSMYRSLVDAEYATIPVSFFEKDACRVSVEETRAYRTRYEAEARRRPLPLGLDRLFRRKSGIMSVREMAAQAAASQKPVLVSIGPAQSPVPEEPIFGHTDQSRIAARSGDRVSVSGWAASRDPRRPIVAVRMVLEGREIGVFRDFTERPEVATTYGRADLLHSGWRGMLFLPALPDGEHNLVPEACDAEGNRATLPAAVVSIED